MGFKTCLESLELLIHINQVIYIFVLKLMNPYYKDKNQLNHPDSYRGHNRKKNNKQIFNIEHNPKKNGFYDRQIPIGI